MLAIPPFGASSNIALWRANIKPPVELVVDDLEIQFLYFMVKRKIKVLSLKVKRQLSVCRFETKEHKHNSARAVIDRKGL